LPLLAAAPAGSGLRLSVRRHGDTAGHETNTANARGAEGAETGTVSAAACGTREGMQRGGAKPCPLPS
jgi:hypothetical protein